MINFIKNIFKSKERIKDRDSYGIKNALLQKIKSKKPLHPTHFDITTPLTQEQYEFLKKTLNARSDYRASIKGEIVGERDSYAINKIL